MLEELGHAMLEVDVFSRGKLDLNNVKII